MEPFIGPVPVIHWMLNLAPEFPFKQRQVKPIPKHILDMMDRARDKRPYDSKKDNTKYERRSRDHQSLFTDPYLRHVSAQAYVLERGQETDVSTQVDALRFLLDVDREGDTNLWEQKWSSFDSVHNREDEDHGSDTDGDDDNESQTTLSESDIPESPKTKKKFGGRLRSFLKKHSSKSRDSSRDSSRSVSRDSSRYSSRDSSRASSRDTTRASSREGSPSLGRFEIKKESRDPESRDSVSRDSDVPGFSATFQHRFQNELNLIIDHPFAPSVFQATGSMFKLRSKGLVKQYLPNLPFRGSHFEQTKQSARAILLMDRCVDAKDRCLKINDFWGKYGLSFKDQINFIYTTCFYELIREVAMNANRIISQLFEDDETKVRRKFKRQRAHRLWEMGDWLVKKGGEMAAQRGIHVAHNPSILPDDVVSSIVAVVSYMEFVVINHRPYQTQTRINYGFVKDGVKCCHVTGDKSDPIHKAAASLWTPWAVASCNPLALSDPDRAEEFSGFDFRYEDVFKKKKDFCECGVSLFQ